MDKNSKIINDKESKTKRWLEHFTENPSNPLNEIEIELLDEIEEIDTSEPSRAEGNEKLKAPSIDNMQAELLEADFHAKTKVKEIMDIVWRKE